MKKAISKKQLLLIGGIGLLVLLSTSLSGAQPSTGGPSFEQLNVSGTLTVGGKAGIGVNDPRAALEIVRDSVSRVGRNLYIKGAGNGGAWPGITIQRTGANDKVYNIVAGSYLEFHKREQDGSGFVRIMSLTPNGNVGIGTSNPRARLDVHGDLNVSGSKNFVTDHPTDPTKEIVYTSLEGPEAGTYIRGTAQLVNGEAVIELPEHFDLVTAEGGLTVQVTPWGECNGLYVAERSSRRIVVRELQNGRSNVKFDYLVQGVRRGYEHHQVIREK